MTELDGLGIFSVTRRGQRSVTKFLTQGVQQVADAGADFYVCPDNTAHIVLEQIADVVCRELEAQGFLHVGLVGTQWTMSGPVYTKALAKRGLELRGALPGCLHAANDGTLPGGHRGPAPERCRLRHSGMRRYPFLTPHDSWQSMPSTKR